MTKTRISIGTLAAVALSCSPPAVDFGDATRAHKATDYSSVQKRWTRSGALYEGVEAVFFVSVLFKSWDWRQAYLSLAQQNFAWTPAERERQERSESTAAQDFHELFVSVSMPTKRWQDLDKKDSYWKLALVNDRGDEVQPIDVRRVREIGPNVRVLYPFHTPFHVAYEIRFKKTLGDGRPLLSPDNKRLTFRFAGAPGKVELAWLAAAVK